MKSVPHLFINPMLTLTYVKYADIIRTIFCVFAVSGLEAPCLKRLPCKIWAPNFVVIFISMPTKFPALFTCIFDQ